MVKQINFDMDGTFVDLYGVEGWLDDLQNCRIRPYKIARPLVNLSHFARIVNKLQSRGWQIGIISWTSKSNLSLYNKCVNVEKRLWLRKHLPSVFWNKIAIVDYGTPKSNYGEGILFDDEEKNRKEWNGIAFDEKDLIQKLKTLLD